MKTNVKVLLLMIVLTICSFCINYKVRAQQFKGKIEKRISFENLATANVFYLANISGNISAEGYDGDEVVLEAEKTITAKTQSRLAKAKEELTLGIIDRYDTVMVYIEGACGIFGKKNKSHRKGKPEWGYSWNKNWDSNCRKDYDYRYDFKLKVPRNMSVVFSTINNGDVEIRNMDGILNVRNVNGSISLHNVSNKTFAHTINGDVSLDHTTSAPSEQSYYYTLNGDIEAFYPKGLRANMTFKSYNGDFFTNINPLVHEPLVFKKGRATKDGSFKLVGRSLMKAGGGGVELAFETFNGDVYVREK